MDNIYNYKICFKNNSSENENIAFAMSKVVLNIEKINHKNNKEAFVIIKFINSSEKKQDEGISGELFIQINITNQTILEIFIAKIKMFLDTVRKHYKIESIEFEQVDV